MLNRAKRMDGGGRRWRFDESFCIGKRVSKEDRACVKNLEASDGLAQMRPELYRLMPEARTWKMENLAEVLEQCHFLSGNNYIK